MWKCFRPLLYLRYKMPKNILPFYYRAHSTRKTFNVHKMRMRGTMKHSDFCEICLHIFVPIVVHNFVFMFFMFFCASHVYKHESISLKRKHCVLWSKHTTCSIYNLFPVNVTFYIQFFFYCFSGNVPRKNFLLFLWFHIHSCFYYKCN